MLKLLSYSCLAELHGEMTLQLLIHLQSDNTVTAAPGSTSKATSSYPSVVKLTVCMQELMHSSVMGDALTWSCLSWAEGVKAVEEAARHSSRYPAEHYVL